MPQYGYPKLKIMLDTTDGGDLVDISSYVTSIGGYSLERLLEEITAAGDTTDRWGAIGFQKKAPIELKGPYDDTAGGLVAITRPWNTDVTRTLQLTFDMGTAADVKNVETLLMKTVRSPKRGSLTEWAVTLQPTGAIT